MGEELVMHRAGRSKTIQTGWETELHGATKASSSLDVFFSFLSDYNKLEQMD